MATKVVTEDLVDGCDLDFCAHAIADDDAEYFVLFAEALDPANPKTLHEVEAEWKDVFDAGA